MRFASVSSVRAAIAAVLLLATVARGGDAQPLSATVPAAATEAPLKIWLDTRGTKFDRAKLRASLAQELKRDVELTEDASAAAVQIRLEGDVRADVRVTTPSGEQLSRSVDLPRDGERSVQVVSWLTVNLVRDEASELLKELRARRKEEADARSAQEQASAEQAAAAKAAADRAAEERAAADKAAADAAKNRAAQAKLAANDAGGSPPAANSGLLRDRLKSFDVALATPISLLRDSPKRELMLQLALWYGEAGGIRGAGVSSVALRIRRQLDGVAVAPAFALVGGRARGALVSVGYAQVDGELDGALVGAGLAVQRGKRARGAVVAGGGAVTGELTGVALGTGFVSAKSLRGVAAAAGITLTRGPSTGVLLAGGVNFSSDHSGFELAGGLNAARDLNGMALAPVNVHRRVKGLQLGVINVAEEVDGASLGVISYAKNGHLQPVLWTSTDGSAHVAIKSIAGYAFTQLGAGVDLGADSFSYDGGVGGHFSLTRNVFFEPGVHYSASNGMKDAAGAPDEHQFHYLAQFGYRAASMVDFLGAAGLRHTISGGTGSKAAPELRAGIAFF